MTKKEKMAYDLGKTFNVLNVPDGYAIAPCFDERIHKLALNRKKSSSENIKIMKAWYDGLEENKLYTTI